MGVLDNRHRFGYGGAMNRYQHAAAYGLGILGACITVIAAAVAVVALIALLLLFLPGWALGVIVLIGFVGLCYAAGLKDYDDSNP